MYIYTVKIHKQPLRKKHGLARAERRQAMHNKFSLYTNREQLKISRK